MGRRALHFQDGLRYLLHELRTATGTPEPLREYLIGICMEAIEQADEMGMGLFPRMLAADVIRLHRSSVETPVDSLSRARLVGSMDRALGRLGLHGVRSRARGVPPPTRGRGVLPPTRHVSKPAAAVPPGPNQEGS